ncbi:MAG: ribonuclease HII, partial [Dehalococcoidia bacterium]|nr:ribonuclease HII [Dehalococcoidia bacterium]
VASVEEIERLNILKATYLAMRRALDRVGEYDHALIDGREIKGFDLVPHTAIVDGDATSYAIACASILAKVIRDRLMQKLALRFPGYGWEQNAGYGTEEHLRALVRLGPTPHHRRTFGPVQATLFPLGLYGLVKAGQAVVSLRPNRHEEER